MGTVAILAQGREATQRMFSTYVQRHVVSRLARTVLIGLGVVSWIWSTERTSGRSPIPAMNDNIPAYATSRSLSPNRHKKQQPAHVIRSVLCSVICCVTSDWKDLTEEAKSTSSASAVNALDGSSHEHASSFKKFSP